MGLLSVRTLLDFGMALLTAVLIADTIKSAYLSRSLKSVKKQCRSERVLVNIFLTNTDIAETKVSLESL